MFEFNHNMDKLLHTLYGVGEIANPVPNFNDETVEVWERIINSIQHFIVHVITFPCWDYQR